MGQAKQRGSFEERKASSKKVKFTKPENFRIRFQHLGSYSQATVSFGDLDNQLVLKASDIRSLFHLLVHFSLDSLSCTDDFLKDVNPSLHEEIHLDDDSLCAYFVANDDYHDDDDDDSVNKDISDIFCTELLPLTDELYARLINTTDFKELSKKDFNSLRSMGLFFNPVRKSFQGQPEFGGCFNND